MEIDITNSKKHPISFISDEDAKNKFNKGWTYSYIYFLDELKDIYLAIKMTQSTSTILRNFVRSNEEVFKKNWTDRKILEYVNALKNYGIIDTSDNIIIEIFNNDEIGAPLTKSGLDDLLNIFLSYFRFKEVIKKIFISRNYSNDNIIESITLNDLQNNTVPVFSFSFETRFTDSFIYRLIDTPDIYYIENNKEEVIRFWDVFLKWGVKLGVLEKFNLEGLGVSINNPKRNINCAYFKRPVGNDFDLMDYLNKKFLNKYLYIPEIIHALVVDYRFSINDIKKMIIQSYEFNKGKISFERTSEIFLKKREYNLFLLYKDSYISHLSVR